MKDYMIAFPDNLAALINMNIKPTELKVILYILKTMEWGNLIGFSQRAACDALGMKKSNMSTIFKNLERKGVLTVEGGHTYLNSNLFAKGLGRKVYANTRERLKAAARAVGEIEAAWDETDIKKSDDAAPVAPAAVRGGWREKAVQQARAQRARVPL